MLVDVGYQLAGWVEIPLPIERDVHIVTKLAALMDLDLSGSSRRIVFIRPLRWGLAALKAVGRWLLGA